MIRNMCMLTSLIDCFDDTEVMSMPLVCPSVRAEGAEEDGLRGRVSGRSGGGV